ncbi:MAG: sigma-54 dependent transcriptional regulator [Bacteroidetes bacterium]|nr:sigma-54 dependent transcriptional regulator [Bacteroidota bacterium]
MNSGKIILIDDHQKILESLRFLLKYHFREIIMLSGPEQIFGDEKLNDADVIILDMNFKAQEKSGKDGLFWLKRILHKFEAKVICLTAYGSISLTVEAMKIGATDFVTKPWENDKLVATIKSALALKKAQDEVSRLKSKQIHLSSEINKQNYQIIGNSPAIQKILQLAHKVAPSDANILITGENGTGKDLIAREIHRLSLRREEAFISIDIGSLSESLFESEFFGHMKGAFTDAIANRTGKFEAASGGTLFLDEIGNLSITMQPKILSALQKKAITPVGSIKEIPVDIRIICATNKNLREMIVNHFFREDLFYRMNTVEIHIPPLRERKEDIPTIANYFLRLFGDKYEKFPIRFDKMGTDTLMNYDWPGNIRELKHTIERAVILCESNVLSSSDFSNLNQFNVSNNSQLISLNEAEKMLISRAMDRNDRNIAATSRELKIGRQSLYRKLKRYRIYVPNENNV